jgi:hypothetical protein
MNDSSLIPIVVVGGAIGIAGTLIGSFVGPLILEARKQTAEKKKKKAEKLEELISALSEHQRLGKCRGAPAGTTPATPQ